MNISDINKKCLPDILAIAFFVLISVAYFFVPMTHGEILGNGDNTAGKGLGRDLQEYTERPARQAVGQTAFSAECRHIRLRRHTRVHRC